MKQWSSGLAFLGLSVLTVVLLTNADGSASPPSAAEPRIAFTSSRIAPQGVPVVELSVVNADGSEKRRLLETARSSPAHERRYPCSPGPCPVPYEPYELSSLPAWSPDGRWIAFVGMGDDANADVYVVGADGRGKRRLTRHPAVEGNPAWSPDGRKIAFTRRGPGFQIHTYVMDPDGSDQRRLTRNGGIHFSVAWSPNGQKLLFERPNSRHAGSAAAAARGEWPEELYIMNADGGGQRRLTRNPARDGGPVWSPDGRQIVFTRWAERQQIWVMNSDGSGQRNLTPARTVSFVPALSPDGRKIAFAGGSRVAFPNGIIVMNADGSKQRRLTQTGSFPAWSPDGRMIAFDRAGLHVMNADASGERKLTLRLMSFAWSPTLPKRS